MKSLRDYSMNLTEQAYHDYPAWSYSTIAKYAKDGFSAIATLHDPVKPTPSMEFGSLFDTILTKGKKTFDQEYYICDVTVPDAEKKALDYIASRTDKPHARLEEIMPEDLSQYCDECQYQSRWGYDARLKHLLPYSDYYNAKRTGRNVVSREEFNDAFEMAKIFRTDPYLSKIFGTKNTDEIEYIYQAQFKVDDWELDSGKKVTVKIMPDLIIVNHKDKTIQPVDLKTSSIPAWQFKDNFIKYRYDIQADLYTNVIQYIIDGDDDYKDYIILPYLFSDISRTDKIPVTYILPKGDFAFSKGDKVYTFKHWDELLDEIIAYEEADAKVPSYIITDGPNDLISILSR